MHDKKLYFNVLTINERQFVSLCRRLQRIVDSSGYAPDIVIGIKSGGEYVAQKMFETVPHINIVSRRSSTRLKRGKFKILINLMLSRLPRILTDKMRIIEARKLHSSNLRKRNSAGIEAEIAQRSEAVTFQDIDMNPKRILIVDDAVDSGVTLEAVIRKTKSVFADAEVRSAVITVTTPDPVIMPDYKIFDNLSLIRFPWAADSRI